MELTKIRMDSWLNQIEKKVFVFLLALLSTNFSLLGSHLVLILPLLSLCFVIDSMMVVSSLAGLLVSVLIFRLPMEIMAISLMYVLLLWAFSYIYVLKTKMIPILNGLYLAGILAFAVYLGQSSLSVLVLSSAISGAISYAYLKTTPLFIHHEQVYNDTMLLILGMMLVGGLLCIKQISVPFLMVLLRFLCLALLYVSDVESGYLLGLYSSLLVLLGSPDLQSEVVAFVVPISLFHVIKVKSKFGYSLVYLFSHWLLPFIISGSLLVYGGEVVLSAILFMLVPNRWYRKINVMAHQESLLVTQIGGVVSYQRKMSRQLENFSDLFFRIAHSFDDATMKTNVLTYVGNIYESTCSQCMNCDQCFNRHQGDHRLVKLMRKGIVEGLNKEELHYVERYCLNMAAYKKIVKEQHQLYAHQQEMNEEYHTLKHHLYSQLSLVGHLLKNYAGNVDCADVYGEERMKDLLEGYHYEVPYLHKDYLSKDEYCIDIGMTEITKNEVHDVVIPVLEKFLDTKLNLLVLEGTAQQLGYMHIVLSNHQNFQLVYGIQQISKDAAYCGDSYLCFNHHQYTMLALSDGMGYGAKAHEESELTLDVFSRLLKSGISFDEAIQTINSLLKIKNRMEMFTTLDLLMFDTNDAKATFLKNGATPSFVYHYNQLDKVQTRALPIGIVAKVDTHKETYQCADQDLIIMYSDGFDVGIEEAIEHTLNTLGQCHPQKLADAIMQELIDKNQVDDDATIIVARVEDVTQIHIDEVAS